jgi:hypothetical protein
VLIAGGQLTVTPDPADTVGVPGIERVAVAATPCPLPVRE